MSHAAAISMNDSRFAPVSVSAGPEKPASTVAARRRRIGLSPLCFEIKLSRRTRILSTGLLMIAASFGLSMLIVALSAL